MIIQIATLCDAAADYSGKLNLLGSFDTIITPQLPAVHPQCSIALRFCFSRPEEGHHKVRLDFVDGDGRPIMPGIDLPVDVSLPEDEEFVTRNLIINIQQLKFELAGEYAINIALDGRQEMSIPLLIKLKEPAQPR